MISKMQKLLLVGPQKKKDEIIEKLQKAGVVEVMPYKGREFATDGRLVTTAKADTALSALKLADKYNAAAANANRKTNQLDFSAADAADKIIELDASLKKIRDELALLGSKMKTVEMLGNFSLSDIRSIEERGKIRIQIWESAKKSADEINFEDVLAVFKIYSDPAKEIFLTCAKDKVTLRKCSEIVLDEDQESLKKAISGLTERRNETESAIFDIASKREDLYKNYLAELDKVSFNRAANGTVSEFDGRIFMLQAWCPKSELANLKKTFENECAAIIEIEPEKDETIPTLIDSKRAVDELGRDLVNIYDTPAYTDWDPSSWVFFSFALFFAMIVGDGGYGILLLVLMIVLKIKIKHPGASLRRFLNLSIVLTAATGLYGILTGGIFGWFPKSAEVPIVTLFKQLDFIKDLPIKDGKADTTNIMMQISILIGMVHICLSLILRGCRALKDERNFITPLINLTWIAAIWSFFFWYVFGNGGSANFNSADPEALSQGGLLGIEISAGILVLLTIIKKITEGSRNPITILIGGVFGLYDGVQFFSDILSYIRIFALGLSGALLAQTFNNLAGQVLDLGAIGYVFAPLIAIAGHALNIALCLMGGVIHGLRLNFLEWYRWCFDGSGRRFAPFRDMVAIYSKGND
ncbi:hypothetical protein J6Z39_10550 [bacterium]|nr:hypothetical protein [bacterium]